MATPDYNIDYSQDFSAQMIQLGSAREAVLSALYNLVIGATFNVPVGGSTRFVTTSRRLKVWTDVPKSERPAMFMSCHAEVPEYRNENAPAYFKLNIKIFVYIDSSPDVSAVPDQDLNAILDAIGAALAPVASQPRQTLGGLVSHARINGEIMRDPGDLDGDGLLIIPIEVALT